jgi:hypothetical protein
LVQVIAVEIKGKVADSLFDRARFEAKQSKSASHTDRNGPND